MSNQSTTSPAPIDQETAKQLFMEDLQNERSANEESENEATEQAYFSNQLTRKDSATEFLFERSIVVNQPSIPTKPTKKLEDALAEGWRFYYREKIRNLNGVFVYLIKPVSPITKDHEKSKTFDRLLLALHQDGSQVRVLEKKTIYENGIGSEARLVGPADEKEKIPGEELQQIIDRLLRGDYV